MAEVNRRGLTLEAQKVLGILGVKRPPCEFLEPGERPSLASSPRSARQLRRSIVREFLTLAATTLRANTKLRRPLNAALYWASRTATLPFPVPTVWPRNHPPVENQDTGISALISACRAGVVTDTGPNSAT